MSIIGQLQSGAKIHLSMSDDNKPGIPVDAVQPGGGIIENGGPGLGGNTIYGDGGQAGVIITPKGEVTSGNSANYVIAPTAGMGPWLLGCLFDEYVADPASSAVNSVGNSISNVAEAVADHPGEIAAGAVVGVLGVAATVFSGGLLA